MKTLIIIDAQNDFMPGGALEVPRGDKIIPVINKIQPVFDLVILTQDWHPETHSSFASSHSGKEPFDTIEWQGQQQVLWPDHCVRESEGAEFHPALETKPAEAIFRKGMDPDIDSYSGFYDNGHKKTTGLAGFLRERGAKDLFFCGLAADVCVNFSVRDALSEGFSVTLIEDATQPIEEQKFQDIKKQLADKGCRFITHDEL